MQTSSRTPGSGELGDPRLDLRAIVFIARGAGYLSQRAGGCLRVTRILESRSSNQEKREQASGLGLVAVGLDDRAREPDREAAQVRSDRRLILAGPVAFVEEQVNGPEHRRQASEPAFGHGPF